MESLEIEIALVTCDPRRRPQIQALETRASVRCDSKAAEYRPSPQLLDLDGMNHFSNTLREALEHHELFKSVARLQKSGNNEDALVLLARALREETFSDEDLDHAGRILMKELILMKESSLESKECVRVRLLGQCTTSWLLPAITAHGFAGGIRLHLSEGEFDNVLQEVLAMKEAPDVLTLLPWNQRLLHSKNVEAEVGFWKQVWSLAQERTIRRIVQIGYDYVIAGPLGHHLSGAIGDVKLVRQMNERLREALPAGSFFVDLEQISGQVGRDSFYEPRQYHWTKQPFSQMGVTLLASHVFAGIRALTTGPKKVLALDLDNTLWAGVVGDSGPLGIELGESPEGDSHRFFQSYLKSIAERGVVLAVVSKNNPEDAREPFLKNPNMVLKMEDFGAFEAGWGTKSEALRRVALNLNLGLDSFVFFDDEPVEREHVRKLLPEVEIVDVPKDPAEYIRALERGLWFEVSAMTDEDRRRSQEYAVEKRRIEVKSTFASAEEYFASLSMKARVQLIDEGDMQRVVQLIGKTNQFNLTTRRHAVGDVRAILSNPRNLGLTLRLRDQFSDYGLVGVVLGLGANEGEVPVMAFDTALMSCRVIGRTVEQFFLRAAIQEAHSRGVRRILAEYIPTPKNAVVASLYDDLGFARRSVSLEGHVFYSLETSEIWETRFRTYVHADA